MKVLVVGSGGREHAICWAFAKSPRVSKLYCASGNAGIARVAECVDIRPDEIRELAAFAETNSIDLTFVGGETPLALGIVDEFERRGLKIIGASQAAARLEASKSFAKDFMDRHQIPTAMYRTVHSAGEAVAMLQAGAFGDEAAPVVVKADGLAAGKGVVVASSRSEAINAINELESLVGAEASRTIVLEECLFGREVSLLMFASDKSFALMPATRDHKRIGEGDTGSNTGGMGTITDASLLTPAQIAEIVETVIKPTLTGCREEGFPFRGILFLGLMMTSAGPKVLEYNVRFGDPETQAILVRLESDIVDICDAMLTGGLDEIQIEWRQGSSACVILAAENYPSKPKTGDVINGIDAASGHDGVTVFHSGTAHKDDDIVTAGGRVLGVTAVGSDLNSAIARAYRAAAEVYWPGMQFRRDIGK